MRYQVSVLDHQRQIKVVRICNQNGCEVHLLSVGASVYRILLPQKCGGHANIILTLRNYEDYFSNACYAGATLAPNAGRIENGKFYMSGREITLSQNDGRHNSHGGYENLSHKNWELTEIEERNGQISVWFCAELEDGVDGFPGNRRMQVRYLLDEEDNLRIEYSAVSDAETYINMSNHCYFNLTGDPKQQILGHGLKIAADYYRENRADNIVSEKRLVENTCFDFREGQILAANMKRPEPEGRQLEYANGYNHAFLLKKDAGQERPAAELFEEETQRRVRLYTTAPALVVYSGGFLGEDILLEQNEKACASGGIALEAQYCPNAPNCGEAFQFLQKGQTWHSEIRFAFDYLRL